MAITPFLADLNIVAALDDEPNDVGGLTSSEFKAKFDEAGNAIKTYINDALIPDIGTETDAKIAAAELASGNIPLGGTAGQALMKNRDTDYDASWQSIMGESESTPSTLMQRDANGRAKVNDPVEEDDIATKGYVDGLDPVGAIKIGIENPFGEKGALCNGAAFDSAEYPELASIIRDAPGVDDWQRFSTGSPSYQLIKFKNKYITHDGSTNIRYADSPEGPWTTVNCNMSTIVGLKFVNGYLFVLGKSGVGTTIATYAYSSDGVSYATVVLTGITNTDTIDVDYSPITNYYYMLMANGKTTFSTVVHSISGVGTGVSVMSTQGQICCAGNSVYILYRSNENCMLHCFLQASLRSGSAATSSYPIVTGYTTPLGMRNDGVHLSFHYVLSVGTTNAEGVLGVAWCTIPTDPNTAIIPAMWRYNEFAKISMYTTSTVRFNAIVYDEVCYFGISFTYLTQNKNVLCAGNPKNPSEPWDCFVYKLYNDSGVQILSNNIVRYNGYFYVGEYGSAYFQKSPMKHLPTIASDADGSANTFIKVLP